MKIFSYLEDVTEMYKETIKIVDGLFFDHQDTIKTIEYYSNDKFISGNRDSLGREKPFYNVCNYRVTTAKTATDLDVKDISYEPDSLEYRVQAMLINKELYKYLKEINFSKTLNEMGFVRPKYGGVLIKKNDDNGKPNISVVDWKNVEVDPVNILKGSIIETHYLLPSELIDKADVWDVRDALDAFNEAQKGKPGRVEVKEISGEMPVSFYKECTEDVYVPTDEDEQEYNRYCFYIAVIGEKKYLLYSEEEKEMRYKYLPWEVIPGRSLGRGVVEEGFEAQVWVNDSVISMKNVMEISGKVVLSTTSRKVSGNAITGIESGHIFELEDGKTISSLNLSPSALPQFERIIDLWNQQYDKSSSTYGANTGEAPPAGTPYSQVALLNQVANSPFEFRREEWGIFLNEVLNDWIFPYLKKRITKAHDLISDFSSEELETIDEAIVNSTANSYIKKKVLAGSVVSPLEQSEITEMFKKKLSKTGSKRTIKIPKDFLNVEGKLTANITGELKNKGVILQSLDSILKTVVSSFNPNTGSYAVLEDPILSKLFSQIIEAAGIPFSSAQLSSPTGTKPVASPDMSAIEPVATETQ